MINFHRQDLLATQGLHITSPSCKKCNYLFSAINNSFVIGEEAFNQTKLRHISSDGKELFRKEFQTFGFNCVMLSPKFIIVAKRMTNSMKLIQWNLETYEEIQVFFKINFYPSILSWKDIEFFCFPQTETFCVVNTQTCKDSKRSRITLTYFKSPLISEYDGFFHQKQIQKKGFLNSYKIQKLNNKSMIGLIEKNINPIGIQVYHIGDDECHQYFKLPIQYQPNSLVTSLLIKDIWEFENGKFHICMKKKSLGFQEGLIQEVKAKNEEIMHVVWNVKNKEHRIFSFEIKEQMPEVMFDFLKVFSPRGGEVKYVIDLKAEKIAFFDEMHLKPKQFFFPTFNPNMYLRISCKSKEKVITYKPTEWLTKSSHLFVLTFLIESLVPYCDEDLAIESARLFNLNI